MPAYEEARSIEGTLDSIVSHLAGKPYGFEVIVAADGKDGTRTRALERAGSDGRILVTGSVARRGKGRAVREAVAIARGCLIGYMDADGKASVEELEKLRPWLEAGWDLAVGSRALPESRIEGRRRLYRRLGSAVFAALVRGLLGLREVRDTQCGLKLFRREVARDLFAAQRIDGYMFDVELLCLASARGYRVREVPIRWRADEDSRLELIGGSFRILADLLRIRAGLR